MGFKDTSEERNPYNSMYII